MESSSARKDTVPTYDANKAEEEEDDEKELSIDSKFRGGDYSPVSDEDMLPTYTVKVDKIKTSDLADAVLTDAFEKENERLRRRFKDIDGKVVKRRS